MPLVKVSLGTRSYDIKIDAGLLAGLGADCAALKLGGKCAVITDENVARHHAKTAMDSLKRAGFEPLLITVPAGEKAKRLRQVET